MRSDSTAQIGTDQPYDLEKQQIEGLGPVACRRCPRMICPKSTPAAQPWIAGFAEQHSGAVFQVIFNRLPGPVQRSIDCRRRGR